jgi:hypothetical protein
LDEGMAGFPDMQKLSPLGEKSAKQIAASMRGCGRETDFPALAGGDWGSRLTEKNCRLC